MTEIGSKTINENQTLSFTVNATDTDGDTLTYYAWNSPVGATFENNTFTWTPTYEQAGTYSVSFVVSDGQSSDTETITITVTDVITINEGLAGFWKFDEANGTTTTDSSGSNNTGILVNNPTWSAGRIGAAITLDGNNDAIEVPTNNFNASSGTISLWVYAKSFSNYKHFLFGHATQPWSNRIQLYTNNMGELALGLGSSSRVKTNIQKLETNQWYNIVLIWNNGIYVVCVDGIAKANGFYTGLSAMNTYADIGNNGNRSTRIEAFDGIIDEVRIYNHYLNANEIAELITLTTADNQPPVLSTISDKSISENETLTFSVNATDPEGSTITYSADNLPAGAAFNGNTFTWTPTYDQAGTYNVTFNASDGLLQDSVTIAITVNNITTLSDDLVGFWKFDELTGTTANDSSAAMNIGTLVNSPLWTTGKSSGAISFDGNNDAVEITTGSFNAGSGTISLWVYAKSFSNYKHFIFGHATQPWSNRVQIYTDSKGALAIGLGDSSKVKSNIYKLLLNNWHHIVLTWDNGNYVIYVDGIAKTNGTYKGLSTWNSYADIGNNGNRPTRIEAFDGIIDEVQIYNRSLTANEVSDVFSTFN